MKIQTLISDKWDPLRRIVLYILEWRRRRRRRPPPGGGTRRRMNIWAMHHRRRRPSARVSLSDPGLLARLIKPCALISPSDIARGGPNRRARSMADALRCRSGIFFFFSSSAATDVAPERGGSPCVRVCNGYAAKMVWIRTTCRRIGSQCVKTLK